MVIAGVIVVVGDFVKLHDSTEKIVKKKYIRFSFFCCNSIVSFRCIASHSVFGRLTRDRTYHGIVV